MNGGLLRDLTLNGFLLACTRYWSGTSVKSQISQDRISSLRGAVALTDSAPVRIRTGFSCFLDAQPTSLVPRHWLAKSRERALDQQLIVNPHCYFSRDNTIHMPFLDSPSPGEETVWVLDAATGAVLPFWWGSTFRNLLSHTRPGETEPPGLNPEVRSVLVAAQVLVEPDYAERRQREHAQMVSRSAAQFRKRGYVPLQGLIHPFHLGALRTYYRQLVRDGDLCLGDAQTSRRYFAHNERIACFFHHQLSAVVGSIVGAPIKPSYVYVASYQPGARLLKHTDRPQCKYSISMCIDFTPAPAVRTPWPLCLETKEGPVKIFQGIGDALLYRGPELPHYRTPLAKDCTSTSIFFHYVHRDFAGPLV